MCMENHSNMNRHKNGKTIEFVFLRGHLKGRNLLYDKNSIEFHSHFYRLFTRNNIVNWLLRDCISSVLTVKSSTNLKILIT